MAIDNGSYTWPPSGSGGGGGVTVYVNFAGFPPTSTNGDLAIDGSTHILYEYDSGLAAWKAIASETTILSVGTIDSATASLNGAAQTGNNLILQSASVTRPGLVNNTIQSFSGNKTFTGTISASNLSGTNTGDVTLGTANGLSLVGQALSLALSSTSTTGSLTSTDWNTFNNKQAAGNYITALTGDATASGPGSVALTLATVNGNVGSFGTASQVSAFTVSGKGLITAAANTAIQIAESQVTNLVSDLAGKQPTGNYITALTGDATASGPGSAALTLATVNGNVGSFGTATQVSTFTVNAKGLITAASNTAIAIPFSQVSGTVPINQGGTGQTSAANAFGALSPLTTKGDVLGFSTVNARVPIGSNGQVLTADSTQTLGLKWATPTAIVSPTVQIFKAGSGTYTKPANVLYIKIRMVGGGGGGLGNGGVSSGTDGTATTFGSSLLTANGGLNGSSGGSTTINSPAIELVSLMGASGGGYGLNGVAGATEMCGGVGAASCFGNQGPGGNAGANGGSATGYGSGGGGGGSSNLVNNASGNGGGAGGYIEAIISSPSATYSYSIGTAGTGGAGALSVGGNGMDGVIIVEEYYS